MQTERFLQQELGVSLVCVEVLHPGCAYAAVLDATTKPVSKEAECGFKLVYSGDTRPCPVCFFHKVPVCYSSSFAATDLSSHGVGQALVKAGTGATLLIHEATMENELGDDAVSKRCDKKATPCHSVQQN